MEYKWCEPCQIDNLKKNFKNWSENEQIDNFIKEKQLNINDWYDDVFEWIPYDQFYNIKKKNKSGLVAAIWKDGPLKYDYMNKKEWIRESDKEVALKYISQNDIDEFLNKV